MNARRGPCTVWWPASPNATRRLKGSATRPAVWYGCIALESLVARKKLEAFFFLLSATHGGAAAFTLNEHIHALELPWQVAAANIRACTSPNCRTFPHHAQSKLPPLQTCGGFRCDATMMRNTRPDSTTCDAGSNGATGCARVCCTPRTLACTKFSCPSAGMIANTAANSKACLPHTTNHCKTTCCKSPLVTCDKYDCTATRGYVSKVGVAKSACNLLTRAACLNTCCNTAPAPQPMCKPMPDSSTHTGCPAGQANARCETRCKGGFYGDPATYVCSQIRGQWAWRPTTTACVCKRVTRCASYTCPRPLVKKPSLPATAICTTASNCMQTCCTSAPAPQGYCPPGCPIPNSVDCPRTPVGGKCVSKCRTGFKCFTATKLEFVCTAPTRPGGKYTWKPVGGSVAPKCQ
jgi:hypothetical protein